MRLGQNWQYHDSYFHTDREYTKCSWAAFRLTFKSRLPSLIFVPKLQTSHISKIPKDHLLDTVSPTIIYSRGALTKTALTCTNIHVPHVIKDTQCLGHVTNTNTIGKQLLCQISLQTGWMNCQSKTDSKHNIVTKINKQFKQL